MSKIKYVWVCTMHPAPDNPPRHPCVEVVFSTEEAARKWADAYNLRANRYHGSYRHFERFEVKAASAIEEDRAMQRSTT